MKREDAVFLLSNLLDRLEVDPQSQRRRLQGVLSNREVEALEFALHQLQEQPAHQAIAAEATLAVPVATLVPNSSSAGPDLTEPAPAPSSRPGTTLPPTPPASVLPPAAARAMPGSRSIALNVDERRHAQPQEDVLLCIDFGTARSKAFATRRDGSVLDLKLGRRAGEREVYPVTSSVWIDEQGLIFLGDEAVTRSLQSKVAGRRRLDSFKDEISQGVAANEVNSPLEPELNPTGVALTYGDVIGLYLAYVTDLAEAELESAGVSRYVRRRFALPCFEEERFRWGERVMREHLARAQVLADTFRGQWKQGITVQDVHRLSAELRQKRALWPEGLVAEAVPEPIAAGASRLYDDTPGRQLVMVVDVGAGTTDFAALVVRENEEGEQKVWRLKGATGAVRQAGNTLDGLLKRFILKHAGVDQSDPSAPALRRIMIGLDLRIRTLKETLFKTGEVAYRLENDQQGRISRESFLADESVTRFGEGLRKGFQEVLSRVDANALKTLAEPGLRVVLTGGGAQLPMVTALAAGETSVAGRSIKHRAAPLVPEPLRRRSPALAAEYLQLAVAIGGSSFELPEDGGETVGPRGEPRSKVGLVRY